MRYFPVEGGVRLTWRWPDGCTQALVLAAFGGGPQPPHVLGEKQGGIKWREGEGRVLGMVERRQYELEGDSFYLPLDTAAAEWKVKVWVGSDEVLTVLGECRIPQRQRVRLEYTVCRQADRLCLSWHTAAANCAPFKFVLRGATEGVPQDCGSGIALLPVSPNDAWPEPGRKGHRKWDIPWPFGSDLGYCRLFMDPSEPLRDWILIRHPDNVLSPAATSARAGKPPSVRKIEFVRPREIVCPHCFQNHDVRQLRLEHETVERQPGMARWATLATEVLSWTGGSQEPKPFAMLEELWHGGESRLAGRARLCPSRDWPVPDVLLHHPTVHLGLLGPDYAGTSTWLASACWRLIHCSGFSHTWGTMGCSDSIHKLDEFLKEGGRQPTTLLCVGPVFLLTGSSRRQALVGLWHQAPENWAGPDAACGLAKHWDGVMYFVDPLEMSTVLEILGDRLPEDASPCRHDQLLPLMNLHRALRQHKKRPNAVPLAVVVSKGDLLWPLDPVLREALRDVPHYHPGGEQPKYDMALHWRVQFAVREFLARHEPRIVQFVESHFPNFAYFCVSQMGSSAKGEEKRFTRFAPWRVEEPLYWLLAKVGIIPTI